MFCDVVMLVNKIKFLCHLQCHVFTAERNWPPSLWELLMHLLGSFVADILGSFLIVTWALPNSSSCTATFFSFHRFD